MKRLMKRWVAMVLAVLMVMGTLPTSAWAARMDDEELPAAPVLDGKKDPVVDTMAKHGGDDEIPTNPVDPDPGPSVDLNGLSVTAVTLQGGALNGDRYEVTNLSGNFAQGTVTVGTGDPQDQIAVLILPNFATRANASSTAASTFKTRDYTGTFVNSSETDVDRTLTTYANNMPHYFLRTNSVSATSVMFDWTNTLKDNNGAELVPTAAPTQLEITKGSVASLQPEKLSETYETGTNPVAIYERGSNTPISVSETGIPFTIFIGGSEGFQYQDFWIKTKSNPLKVEILTKDAQMRAMFCYAQKTNNTNANYGEQLFSEVVLTNSTNAPMVVNVTIERAQIKSTKPTHYGNNKISGNPTDTIYTALTTTEGLGGGANLGNYTVERLYGLLGNEEGDAVTVPNRKWVATMGTATNQNATVQPGANAMTQTTLSNITIPANGSTTIYVAGTARTAPNTIANVQFQRTGLNTFTKEGKTWRNFWNEYTITATSTTDATVTAYDNAGISLVPSMTAKPHVRLVHGTDIVAPKTDTNADTVKDDGTVMVLDSTAASTGTKEHKVFVAGESEPLIWNEKEKYYWLGDENKTVSVGRPIIVDGVTTDIRTVSDQAESQMTLEVPMGTVTVNDDPSGKADNIKGHYIWDTTADGSIKKVSYTYYPIGTTTTTGATVGVYANNKGFKNWTGVTSTATLTNPSGTALEVTGDSAKTVGAQVKVTGDMTVTANYVQPLTLVTTFDGSNPGTNEVTNTGNRDKEHVFNITVTKGSKKVASAVRNADDTYTLDNIAEQNNFRAWEITLDADTGYSISINGVNVYTGIDTTGNLETTPEGYNFVVELAGVTPKVEGTTQAGSTLVLKDDLNPSRTRGDVTITGAANNADGNIVLYYPTTANRTVTGAIASGDVLESLTYPTGEDKDKIATKDDSTPGTWKLNSNNMQFATSGTNPLVAKYGAADGTATVTIMVDAAESDDPVDATKGGVQLGDASAASVNLPKKSDGVYEAKVSPNTYQVYVNGDKIDGKTLTVTGGGKGEATVQYWTVNFVLNGDGATGAPAKQTILNGKDATKPTTDPTRSLYTFKGWYNTSDATGGTAWPDTNTVTAKQTWYARWERNKSNIKFDYNDEGATSDLDYEGETGELLTTLAGVSFPADPSWANHRFVAWKNGNTVYSASSLPSFPTTKGSTLTITAEWVEQSHVQFNNNHTGDNSNYNSSTGDKNTTVKSTDIPSDPTWDGYTFDGWYTEATGGTKVEKANMKYPDTLNATTTYYAHWSAKPVNVTITVKKDTTGYSGQTVDLRDADNATTPSVAAQTTGSSGVLTFSAPTRADGVERTYYVFVGGKYVNETVKVKPNVGDSATVQYWTVTLTAGTGAKDPKVNGSANSVIVLDGTENVALSASVSTNEYNPNDARWEKTTGVDLAAASTTTSATLEAITATTTWKVSFAKHKATVDIVLRKDGGTWTGTTVKNVGYDTVTGKDPTSGVVTFTDVEYSNSTTHTVTIGGNNIYKTFAVNADTVKDGKVTVYVDYYTLTLTVADSADDGNKHGAVAQSTSTIVDGDYGAEGVTKEGVYIYNTKVNVNAKKTNNLYDFDGWTGTDAPAAQSAQVTMNGKKEFAATFVKTKFDTALDLRVNQSEVTQDEVTAGTDVTAVSLTYNGTTQSVSYDSTSKTWKATTITNVTNASGTWTVTTVDGASYEVPMKKDDVAELYMYGVRVQKGVGNTDAKAPYLVSSGTTRVVMPASTDDKTYSRPISANPADGYTHIGWNAANAADPTTALAAAQGKVSSGAFSLAKGYDENTDLYLMPTYTFWVDIQVQESDGTPKDAIANTLGVGSGTVTKQSGIGKYRITDLDPATTPYTISANNYTSDKTFSKAEAGTTVDLILYKVSVLAYDDSAGAEKPAAGTPKVSSADYVYIPQGGSTPESAPLNLTADEGSGYRLATSANSGENALWTVKTTNASAVVTLSAVNSDTAGKAKITAISKDIELYAHFIRQFKATVSVSGGTKSTALFTAKSGGGTTIANDEKSATVDKGTYVKAEFAKGTGETLTNWSFTKGKLYGGLTDAGAVDTTKAITSGAAAGAAYTTVYFVPENDDATLVANVIKATYFVKVKVNLDNETETGATVKLRNGSNEYDTEYDADSKYYISKQKLPFDTTYDVLTDVRTGSLEDTGRDITFNALDGDTSEGTATGGDDKKLETTLDYYHVNLVVDTTAGAGTGTVNFGTSKTSDASTSKVTAIYLGSDGDPKPINIFAKPEESDTVHNRFGKWEITKPTTKPGSFAHSTTLAAETYNFPNLTTLTAKTDGNFNITSDNQITLTVTFVKQYRVEVRVADTDLTSSVSVYIKKDGETSWATDKYVLVDAGQKAAIGKNDDPARYFFKDWTIKTDDGKGEFTNNTAKGGAGVVGYLAADTFKPEADSVLLLNMWEDAQLAGGDWQYDIGTGEQTSTNPVAGRLTWNAHDAQDPDAATGVTVKGRKEGATTYTLVKDTHYTVSGTTYIFKESFLDNLPIDTYDVTFTYDLGKPTDHKNVYEDQTKPAVFKIVSTKHKLTEARIQVEDASATASPDAGTRDAVTYKEHVVDDPDIKHTELQFTWYYADEVPYTKNDGKAKYDTKAQAEAALAAVSGLNAKKIEDTNLIHEFDANPGVLEHKIKTGAVDVTDDMKGKYIFAIVTVDPDSVTGTGTVITNAIPVDFDAEITVREDDEPITAAGDYAVYLWPTNGGTFNKDSASAKKTTFNTTKKVFETTGSALTATATYHVYVREVEGDDTHYLRLGGNNPVVISRTDDTAEADYYTVTLTNVPASLVTHAEDAGNQPVGETFTDYPSFSAATGNGTNIGSGKGVLKGSTVNAKAKDLGGTNAGKAWIQDYTLTWRYRRGNYTNTTAYTATDQTRTSATAITSAYQYTNSLAARADLTGALKQNTYVITGNIIDENGSSASKIASATLTVKNGANTYTFNNLSTEFYGNHGTYVRFQVPKSGITGAAINTTYTIEAVKGNDSTTIKGYSAPAASVRPATSTTAVTVDGTNNTGRFTIFLAATDRTLEVKDNDNPLPTGHSATAQVKLDSIPTGKHGEDWVFANYNGRAVWEKKVTITNKGNVPMDVELVLQKITTSDEGATWNDSTPTDLYKTGTNLLTGDDNNTDNTGNKNKVQFFDLDDAFTLAANGDSKTFTVRVPIDLDNDDDVKYRFAFTSNDGRDGVDVDGPSLNFDLTFVINPVTVGRVTAEEQPDGSFKVLNNWIKEDVKKPISSIVVPDDYIPAKAGESLTGDSSWGHLVKPQSDGGAGLKGDGTPKDTNDIEYTWWVAPWGAVVELDKATGELTSTSGGAVRRGQGDTSKNTLTYMPKDEERGMALYLVAHGKNNAQGAAMTPSRAFLETPIPVPYPGVVRVYQDGNQVATEAEAQKYTVYLWDTSKGTFNKDDAITTTVVADPDHPGKFIHKTAANALHPNGTYAVYVSAMEGDTTHIVTAGKTIIEISRSADVHFYKVAVNNTDVTQGDYEGKGVFGQVDSDKSNYFYKDHTPPTPAPSATGNRTDTTDVTNKHVLTGTEVTFTYPDWDKDYDLKWSGPLSATTYASTIRGGAHATQTLTYSEKKAALDTVLDLRTYAVTANVTGSGRVDRVTMVLTDTKDGTTTTYKFASKTDSDHNVIDTPKTDGIIGGDNAVFNLPHGAGYVTRGYMPSDSASTLISYTNTDGQVTTVADTDHPENTTIDVNVEYKADNYTLTLQGDGLTLQITDNIPAATTIDGVNLETSGTGAKTATAGINPTADGGYEPASVPAEQTIHLNYNSYKTDFPVTLTFTNLSKYDDAGNTDLQSVTFVRSAGTTQIGGSDVITIITADSEVSGTGIEIPTQDGSYDTKVVKLNVPAGLNVGQTYKFVGTASFQDNKTPANTTSTTYTLNVIIDPLPFSAVTTKPGSTTGSYAINDYNVQPDNAAEIKNVVPSKTDAPSEASLTGLKHSENYAYIWVTTPVGESPDVKWNSNGTYTLGGNTRPGAAANNTGAEYTPATADQGRDLYLVIYANKQNGNAKELAYSAPITQGYRGILYVNEDGDRVLTAADNTAGPGYTVNFVTGSGDNRKTLPATWTEVETGKYAYVNAKLQPNLTYTVEISPARGKTNVVPLSGVSLTGTKLGVTLAVTGTTDPNNFTNVAQADFFTVNTLSFYHEDYDTGTGETFSGAITPEVYLGTAKADANKLNSGTPVLSGQTVKAWAADLGGDNAGKGWTQDYTLTWRERHDGTTVTQDDADHKNLNDTSTAGQSATDAVTTGYPYGAVTAKTYIGGRLDQKTYTVIGTVVGSGGHVDKVTMASTLKNGDAPKFTFQSQTTSLTGANYLTDSASGSGNNGIHGEPGDTVTFTVVQGSYDITAFDGTQIATTIQKVTVDDDVDLVKDRDKETLNNVANNDRVFTIYVEPTALKLKVSDDQGTPVTATSSTPVNSVEDNKHGDNTQVFYFDLTAGEYDLTLSNLGNSDLKAKVELYTTTQAGLTAISSWSGTSQLGTSQTSSINASRAWTHTGITEFTSLLADNTDIPVGAGVTGSGVDAVKAGHIKLLKAADNADDTVYIIRYTSTYVDNNSTTAKPGPTVYYVLNLRVDPLPIVAVSTTADDDGTLRLEGSTTASGTTTGGLDHVLVDHDGKADTDPVPANAHGIVDTDVTYVWYSAPTSLTEEQVRDSFTWPTGADAPVPTSNTSDIVIGAATSNNTPSPTNKTYKPTDAEQGRNLYLVAYRTAETSNTKDFAVSNALFAQVTVTVYARRTDKTAVDSNEPTLPTVSATWKEDTKTSQGGQLVVNKSGEDITLAAPENDNNTPADAKWHFMKWGDGTGFDDANAHDTTYSVKEKSTVIGYYDLLPTLTGPASGGYNSSPVVADNKGNRTFTYKHNDGSGNVVIYIKPEEGNSFQDGSTTPMELNSLRMEEPPVTIGDDGQYVVSTSFITTYLKEGFYEITFYDKTKGATTNGSTPSDGYEGYDRTVRWKITEGEKEVIARVKDEGDENEHKYHHGDVQITNSSEDDTKNKGDKGKISTLGTDGGGVTLHAFPDDGYVFDHWERITGTGKIADVTAEVTNFSPDERTEVVEASFKPADMSAEGASASVFYGNTKLEDTPGVVTVTGHKGATQSFTVSLPDYSTDTTEAAALKAYLMDDAKMTEADADAAVTKATAIAAVGWLAVKDTTQGTGDDAHISTTTFQVNGSAKGINVQKKTGADGKLEDVTDEVVAYVKIYEAHTDRAIFVPYTVNVMTTPLTIVTANTTDSNNQQSEEKVNDGNAYKDLFAAATTAAYPGEGRAIDDGDTVFFDYFDYIKVQSTKNSADSVDSNGHPAKAAGANRYGDATTGYGVVDNGYWTVNPPKFTGSGDNEYEPGQNITNSHDYTFTFNYTGDPDSDEDDYNYESTKIVLTIPALAPEMSLKFGDEMNPTDEDADFDVTAGTNSDPVDATDTTPGGAPMALDYVVNAFRTDETITYLDNEPIYTVKLKKVGTMYDPKLVENEGTVGFEVIDGLPAFTGQSDLEFRVKLTPVDGGSVWVGDHTISFTATGNSQPEGAGTTATATYTLTVHIDPKVITTLDVTVLDPSTTPTSVTGTTEDDQPVDNKTPDAKKNVPIEEVTVVWGPAGDKPDGRNTGVTVTVKTDPNYKYAPEGEIEPETELTVQKTVGTTTTNYPTPEPDVTRDSDRVVTITQPIPYLMHDDDTADGTDPKGPAVTHSRTVSVTTGATGLGSYVINLGAYGIDVYDVEWTLENDTLTTGSETGIGAVLDEVPTGFDLTVGGEKQTVTLDLSAVDTSKAGSYSFTLVAKGNAKKGEPDSGPITSTYTFTLNIRNVSVPTPSEPACPCKVLYHVGPHGTTSDATIEDVSESNRPSKVPAVTPLDGYVLRGWSLTNPATLRDGDKLELVDPKTVTVKGEETMIFYAVIVERPYHEHYVIGYPNGNFGPADNINRASVATIIARAILPDFVEGSNYGNPGGYSDVSGHWAESAIAYCSKFGVFNGYTDGTFKPDQPITRQEFALVMARLDGVLAAGDMPFDDIDEAGEWALGGIYTAYVKGWVIGYTDGTFKPLNNIRRDEAVKVFNAYLNRGVDADGLHTLHEYVHSGVASNNTENGTNEYMTWPDVPREHWAYYEIVEAANDHEYEVDFDSERGYTVPETWEKCWIDERWRYHDDINDGGPNAALVSAGFRVWLH